MYCQCAKSELSVFDPLPIQSVVRNGVWEDIYPLHTVVDNDSPIEFRIQGNDGTMLDLNDTMLLITGKIVRNNGANLIAADNVAMVNLGLHSMFHDISVYINDQKVEGGHYLYPYKAYMSTLTQYSNASKKYQLSSAGFYKDTPGKHDIPDENAGYEKRRALATNSKVFQLSGKIFSDFLQQGKYLVASTNIGIKLIRSKPEFFLQSPTENASFTYKMTSATLYVRRCVVDPSVLAGHLKGIQTKPVQYAIQQTNMQTFSISQGLQSVVHDNLFNGKSPKLVLLGLVENASLNGTYLSSPFNFKHFNVSEISLLKNGETCPYRPLTPDFSDDDNMLCQREYMSFFQSLGMFDVGGQTNGISYNDWSKGSTMYAFNLCPDLEYDGSHGQIKSVPNIRIEIKFRAALPSAVNVIILSIYDAVVTINRDSLVSVDD